MNIILILLFIVIKIGSFYCLYNYFNNKSLSNYITNISYNSIYYYSKLQLGFIKGSNIVKDYVKSTPLLINFINNIIGKPKIQNKYEIIKHNCSIIDWNENHILTCNESIHIMANYNYDFIIYSDNSESCVNNIILDSLPRDNKVTYEKANYKFVMIEIIYNDVHISLNLKTEENNFFIVNNKLDTKFISYFLKKYHNITDFNSTNYIVKIIDHNVNMVEFSNTQFLLINKDKYSILDCNNESTNESNETNETNKTNKTNETNKTL